MSHEKHLRTRNSIEKKSVLRTEPKVYRCSLSPSSISLTNISTPSNSSFLNNVERETHPQDFPFGFRQPSKDSTLRLRERYFRQTRRENPRHDSRRRAAILETPQSESFRRDACTQTRRRNNHFRKYRNRKVSSPEPSFLDCAVEYLDLR